MQKMLKMPLLLALLSCLILTPLISHADDSTGQTATEEPAKVNASTALPALQKRLDALKQRVSAAKMDKQFTSLNDDAQKLASEADKLAVALAPQLTQIQAQLDVLGPAPAPGTLAETPQVVSQRKQLNNSKTLLTTQIEQTKAISVGAQNLSSQISGLRRDALKTQIALNTGSILGEKFWSPVVSYSDKDAERFGDFGTQVSNAWDQAWSEEWRLGTGIYLLLALGIGLLGRRGLDSPMNWILPRWLPQGRFRRSFLACFTTLSTTLTLGISMQLLCYIFTRLPDTSALINEFAEQLVELTYFSAVIAGLGIALLSNNHPSWRLPGIADPIAKTLATFPILLATFIFIFGIIEQLNALVGASIAATLFGNGLSALLVALNCLIAPIRVNRIRRKMRADGEQTEARSTVAGLIHLVISLTAFVILLALLIGYIPLARFVTFELLWIGLVVSSLYLLIHFVVDLCEAVFSPSTQSGKILKSTLSVNDRHLSLAATLFSALGKTTLLIMAAVALLNGTFGTTTPMELLTKIADMWGGKGLEGMNIIPAHALNAVLCLVVGWYVLRSTRRWLDNDFLPKTNMDRGLRASLVTLFTNVGYVLIIMLTLSMLGIEWNKLAWIVSALSVGIGFGLQEIVKNFISGLILLTERPVKVGDLVSISGVEGDIRRINVRATEIQLGDKSTVIVPNSQLISQNVRNATMGNAQGVATIALTFPLDIDPEQVRNLLLEAYNLHESILENPKPSVSFKELGPTGIVLSVTGYVNSPRMVSSTRSDLLYEILKMLRAAGVSLSQTQTMVLEQPISKIATEE
ncbi:mechanosensitive ion channel family protein [Buttiauxella izardii]|uniref:Mechanosensitive ion channel family protein n=2 Tax=Buttiauxella izardii TaxID=82991 RepID=A0A3A5JNZ3_9ENTR|nr:mechanosensitive ion channel family protein [Buttiauxella izardii]